MPLELTVTANGRLTLRQTVLDHLGAKPGDKVAVSLLPDGKVDLTSAFMRHNLSSVRGALRCKGQRRVSLEEMQAAIEVGRGR
jgi:antitoxin PrlF